MIKHTMSACTEQIANKYLKGIAHYGAEAKCTTGNVRSRRKVPPLKYHTCRDKLLQPTVGENPACPNPKGASRQ